MGLVFLITRDFSEVGKVGAGTYMTREIGGGGLTGFFDCKNLHKPAP